MIDKQKINEYLKVIANLSDEELVKYQTFVNSEIKSICECLIQESDADDERVIALVGAKANYDIALAKSSEDGVVSFSAGDISISENSKYLDNAKALVDLAYKKCTTLLSDNSFAFLGV